MPVLKPLHDEAGLTGWSWPPTRRSRASGLAGVAELAEQLAKTVDRAAGADLRRRGRRLPGPREVPGPHRPQRGPHGRCDLSTTDRARPTRSRSSATRAARSSASPTWRVTCTCVRVPVFTGHSAAIVAELRAPDHPRAGHRGAGRRPRGRRWPTCRRRSPPPGGDVSLVGRIRGADGRTTGPGPVRRGRQPAQGRRPQRRADRRGPTRRSGALAEPALSRRPRSPGLGAAGHQRRHPSGQVDRVVAEALVEAGHHGQLDGHRQGHRAGHQLGGQA